MMSWMTLTIHICKFILTLFTLFCLYLFLKAFCIDLLLKSAVPTLFTFQFTKYTFKYTDLYKTNALRI